MDCYIGTILPWAGRRVPKNWKMCQGQRMPISQYQALYSVIGNLYGGDNSTYFCLPNLQGRIPVGAGTVPGTSTTFVQGAVGGVTSVTLSPAAIPQHTHSAAISGINVNFALRVSKNTATNLAPRSDGTAANFGLAAVDSTGTGTDVNIYKDISNDNSSIVKLRSYPCDVTSSGTVTINTAGNSTPQPVDALQPYQVLKYIICYQGEFPMRN